MSRPLFVMTLAVGGLLFGCGGQDVNGEAAPGMVAPEETGRDVSAMATNVVYGPNNASRAAFTDADNLYAYDDAGDGYAGVAQVNVNGNTYTAYAGGGAGTMSAPVNLSVPAGTPILLRACLGSGGALVACNGWVSFVAR